MASPNPIAQLVYVVEHALEVEGAQLLAEDKAAIEQAFDGVADADANKLVDAIASHITMHGLAGIGERPLRDALTGAEPTLDGLINSNAANAIDGLQALLTRLGSAR